ncbi:rhodanese-like domain-containing protein [Nafulsella turpanensis]|uniref:rhodanese-like domain-containing protein n=1 Tax=Nafulsella turpanensis TaxID=1265690 RepID=UPI00126910D7|nr:rhodanese-like domain-containing protein [Nafulsella turpanensis]
MEEELVDMILKDQPYIPKYFSYNVALNQKGADAFEESEKTVPRLNKYAALEEGTLVVDTRPAKGFKAGHVAGAINIMDGGKFETWLGSMVEPEEAFYLIAESKEEFESLIRKCAKIGYYPIPYGG